MTMLRDDGFTPVGRGEPLGVNLVAIAESQPVIGQVNRHPRRHREEWLLLAFNCFFAIEKQIAKV
jgi:hypothetical protein